MNDHVISPSRRPIIIADSHLSIGDASSTVRHDDAEALLRDYLRLIRRVRNQQRARSIALRRIDIETLADHLDWSDEQVLARLADLMGATRHQRAMMLAVLATGAALITVVSPMSAAAVDSSHGSLGQTDPLVVVDADELTYTRAATSARPAARVVASAGDDSTTPRHVPVLDAQAGPTASEQGSARHDFVPPADPVPPIVSEESPTAPPAPPESPTPASEPAVGPDGATVAVGQPPVPPTTHSETGVDADGNTVAVGQPPVPPAPEPVDVDTQLDSSSALAATPTEREAPTETTAPETGTDASGNTVAVGQPPVPPAPAPETGVDADGNTVAVGQPPVPPAPDA